MSLLAKFEEKQISDLTEGKAFPNFKPGDTIKVYAKIVEGANERIQMFEGLVLRRKNRALNSTFTVRKISNGEGVERTFMLYSPRIDKIELVKRGKVRRSKLYYMRKLTGKAARIKEVVDYSSTR